MARIRLIHWDGPEGRERKQRLAAMGHVADFDDEDGPALGRLMRANPPDLYLIDLSRLPSHGREVALSLRSRKDSRQTPIVFVGGEPEKVAKLKAMMKDAGFVQIRIVRKGESREIVTGWVPGGKAEDCVASASIEAFKPALG